MKTIDLFCASPAATAICSSMDQRATVPHGMRAIDRHIHRLGDRPKPRPPPPCSSQLPIDPRTYYHKTRKSSTEQSDQLLRRKSSADVNDDLGSARYLLSDKPFLDSDDYPVFKSLSTRSYEMQYSPPRNMLVKQYANPVFKSSPKASNINDNMLVNDAQKKYPLIRLSDHLDAHKSNSPTRKGHRDLKVVELMVSIHCKGCEGKLRKHISRMEGVTSFNIDLTIKKVTVIGDVTPHGVLASISKVKNAQFWPSPTSSSSSSSPRVGRKTSNLH